MLALDNNEIKTVPTSIGKLVRLQSLLLRYGTPDPPVAAHDCQILLKCNAVGVHISKRSYLRNVSQYYVSPARPAHVAHTLASLCRG